MPVERQDGHVDHHRDQRRHRNHADQISCQEHQQEQEQPGKKRREPGPGTRDLHVDHGLADHRAPTHAAEETGDQVGHTLPPGLAGLAGSGVGDVVHQLGCEQRFEQAHGRHRERVGEDDPQRFQRGRDIGQHQRWD